ncbi:flagellar hook assembly protein FlgD [Gayadomonas joobiniege]|uniref:flagellar hook assembly protein FlgD n=1 Tax=Gayadomonas joobiniege TaxID=1234606 RepID=UPI0003729DA6|nr:FlgD immunoglobulin-like domain containing protein [Gayadomonas joobiniege]
MTSVSSSTLNSLYWDKTEQANETEVERNQMDQEDFFSLLTTQLAAQDPTNPASNEEMISQMTAFTTADGVNALGEKFDVLSAQLSQFLESTAGNQTSNSALQASSMIGQQVLVGSEEAPLFKFAEDAYGMAGQLMFDDSMNDIRLELKDASGKVVNTLELGAATEGPVSFNWDGTTAEGEQLSEGVYTLTATGINASSGEREEISTATYSTVSSVSFGAGNSLSMNLAGLGAFSMDDILEISL